MRTRTIRPRRKSKNSDGRVERAIQSRCEEEPGTAHKAGIHTGTACASPSHHQRCNLRETSRLLSENPAGLFQIRDELTGWLAGLERQGREQERAFFLECWNGDAAHTIDRIGRGSVFVPHACVSQFGGIQPARLRSYLADALKDGPSNDGLMQRFQLMVWPDIPPGWQYVDRKPDTNALDRTAEVYRRMAALDATNPLRLQFDDEAQALFEQWLTDLEQRIRAEEVHPPCKPISPNTAA